MIVRSFLDELEAPECAIAVVGDDAPVALEGMLGDVFDEQPIDVLGGEDAAELAGLGSDLADGPDEAESALGDGDAAVVLLEDGDPVAASSMSELYESILAINSDLFVTGARGLGEIALPDVLAGLADTRLRLRSYPLAHKEKLLLILVSRYIEQSAWEAGSGTLRSAFQRLSRIEDEVGTRAVYAGLERTDVDVHVYGVDDGSAPELDVHVHAGDDPDYRDSWFVVYRPAEDVASEANPAALVCLEAEPRIWEGFFTFDPDRVAAVDDAIATELR